MLLQNRLDTFFNTIEDAIVCDKDTANYVTGLKPPQHEIETLGWRYRTLGFIEAMLIVNKIRLEDYESFFHTLFEQQHNQINTRNKLSTQFAVRVHGESGYVDFDVMAQNKIDAYYQLTKRITYRAITDITRIEVFTGMAQHIASTTTPPPYIFDGENLITFNLEDLSLNTTQSLKLNK